MCNARRRDTFNCAMNSKDEGFNEKYLNGSADIPECRSQSDLDRDYRDFPEEKIWSPKEEVNEWVSLYVFMARSVLTFAQEGQGIPNREAMENSCTGYAEQYITDVLHDSEYLPEVALRTLLTKELPEKLIGKWTSTEIELFIKGITQYGKNFANTRLNLLPKKTTKDIVDFYYAWKWTDSAKGIRISRRRRRTKGRFPSINCIFGELNSPRIQTRSALAASKDSTVQKINGICSCDSSSDNSTSTPKRKRNACSATGDITPQKNQETYHPDSSTFTAKWKRKSSIAYRESIPEKVLDIFHRESLCGNSTSIALKKQNSSTQSAYRRRSDRYSFKKRFS